ncbi:hypothetical protein PIB30_094651, partial [Stylosanthes scabra]|nr:hypothetical protein [Stylosanthes scabra]
QCIHGINFHDSPLHISFAYALLRRLCVGHLILDRAELFFHAYALLRRMCVALKMLGRSLPSTHMRAVLRICVALGRAS